MLTRRAALVGGISLSAIGWRIASAQTGITSEQRREYARQFVSRSASTRELSVLRDIQEGRVAVPSSIRNLERFARTSPAISAMAQGTTPELGMLMFWNGVALEATSLDHFPDRPDVPAETYAEQIGPARSSRALAIVHVAMFEAVNIVFRRFRSFAPVQGGQDLQGRIMASVGIGLDAITPTSASVKTAITEAAFGTLVACYPRKEPLFVAARAEATVLIGDSEAARTLGAKIGVAAAVEVMKLRLQDGASRPDLSADDFASNDPHDWRKDPISQLKPALGGNWDKVRTWVLTSAAKHRPKPPPRMGDIAFTEAYKEVKALGGDPSAPTVDPRWPTQTTRSGTGAQSPLDLNNQTFVGIFWAYDGTALLCAPPRLYNMVATSVALKERPITRVEEMARYLALVNVAMADAAIAAWEAKYHYVYARPITTIRSMDADGTPEGARDPRWTPLGAPVSNGEAAGRNLSPPFPAYPSGHAVFGGAVFQVMRRYWELPVEGIPFAFVSDEYNGRNRGPGDMEPRPRVEINFPGFDKAERDNADSRIYLGIHWRFDADAGIEQGRAVGNDVFDNAFSPV